jgi:hypothetical protein
MILMGRNFWEAIKVVDVDFVCALEILLDTPNLHSVQRVWLSMNLRPHSCPPL